MAGARPCCISPCELGLPPRQPHLAAIFPKCWRMGTLSPLSRKCRARAQLSAPFHVRPWLLSLSAFYSAPATAPQCRHPVKLCKPRSAAPLCSDAELPTPGPLSSGPHPPAAAMAELSGAAPLLSPPQRRCLSCSSMEILSAADCLASRCPSSPSGARRADPASHPLQLAIPPVAARWLPLLPGASPRSGRGRSHRRPSSSSVAGHPPCLHGHVQRALFFFPVLSPARRNAAARSGHGSSLCRALGVRRIAAAATPFAATRSPGRSTRRRSAQPLHVVVETRGELLAVPHPSIL